MLPEVRVAFLTAIFYAVFCYTHCATGKKRSELVSELRLCYNQILLWTKPSADEAPLLDVCFESNSVSETTYQSKLPVFVEPKL